MGKPLIQSKKGKIEGGKIRQTSAISPYFQKGEPDPPIITPEPAENRSQTSLAEAEVTVPKKVASPKPQSTPDRKRLTGRKEKKWTVMLHLNFFPSLYDEIKRKAALNGSTVTEEIRFRIESLTKYPLNAEDVIMADERYRVGLHERRNRSVMLMISEQMHADLKKACDNATTSKGECSINDLIIAACTFRNK